MERFYAIPNTPVFLGRVGENKAREIAFDISQWLAVYGEGSVQLMARRAGETVMYPVPLTRDGNLAIWTVTAGDVAKAGRTGECELSYTPDSDTMVKSESWSTAVLPSMAGGVVDAPEAATAWIDALRKESAAVEQLAGGAEESAAAAAKSAVTAGSMAAAAAKSAEAAAGSASEAKTAKTSAQKAAVQATEATQHYPFPHEGTGTWWVWDVKLGKYVNTGLTYGGSTGTEDHRKLANLEAPNQHPITAITGLSSRLSVLSTAIDNVDEQVSTLSEEIAASTADWSVNDENDPAYVKNRTHYSDEIVIEWDGNTEGLYCVADKFYRVSDSVIDNEVIKKGTIKILLSDDEIPLSLFWDDELNAGYITDDITITASGFFICVRVQNKVFSDITFEKTGVYFAKEIFDNRLDNYTTKFKSASTKPLDEKYIPSTIQRAITGASGQIVGFDADGKPVAQDNIFIQAPASAEVGQAVVVKAVDENGKPTEWETVVLPSGGGEATEETWELLGDVTLEEDASSVIFSDIGLENYKKFAYEFSANVDSGTQVFVNVNGANATTYAVGNIPYAGAGYRRMRGEIMQNLRGYTLGWFATYSSTSADGDLEWPDRDGMYLTVREKFVSFKSAQFPISTIKIWVNAGNMKAGGRIMLWGAK